MKKILFENIGGNAFRLAPPQSMGMMESEQLSSEEVASAWEDDKDGEYIQIAQDGSVYYVANGRAMEQIAPKGTGKDMFRRIGTWSKVNNVYLNIWRVNDHGNLDLLNGSGRIIGSIV